MTEEDRAQLPEATEGRVEGKRSFTENIAGSSPAGGATTQPMAF